MRTKVLYSTEMLLKVSALQTKKDLQIYAVQSLGDMTEEYSNAVYMM